MGLSLKLMDIQMIKERIKTIRDFCNQPVSELAGYPLRLFDKLNKIVGFIAETGFENNPFTLCKDLTEKRPWLLWLTSLLWIPATVIYYFLLVFLFYGLCYGSIALLIAVAIIFCIACKVTGVVLFFLK